MKEEQKNLKWSAILMAVLDILLGIVAIVIPEEMLSLFAKVISWSAIAAGVILIIVYLVRDVRINFFRNDFIHGLALCVVGIVLLRKPDVLIGLIPMLLGLLVVFSGCVKLQDAVDMKRLKTGNWGGMLAAAVVNLGLGIFLIWKATEVATTMFIVLGVVLILSGISDLIVTIYFSRKFAKFEKAVRNAAFEEVPPAPQPPRPGEMPRS